MARYNPCTSKKDVFYMETTTIKKYFKIPYIMYGEFEEANAYIEAKDEDSAKRKLVFHLSATAEENKEFAIEDLTYGLIEEFKLIA